MFQMMIPSIKRYLDKLYQHVHNQAKCYPTLANGITVIGGAGGWVLGNFIEVIPVNTITSAYDVHWINFESASATDTYELVLFKGVVGSEIEIGRIRTKRDSAQSGVASVPIQIPAQSANTRLSAKLASSSGGDNVIISLFYHIYS